MKRTRSNGRTIAARRTVGCLLLIAACAGRAEDLTQLGGDSESHFLAFCQPGECADGLVCRYGVCTDVCTTNADCSSRAPNAVCRTLQQPEAVCDVSCSENSDCSALGAGFSCSAGLCRASEGNGSLYRACSTARPCAGGLACIDNTCSLSCAGDADCESGARCVPSTQAGLSQSYCAFSCPDERVDSDSANAQCAILGAGGRCSSGLCRETLTSECVLAASDGSELSCYQGIAEDAFRLRHEALLTVDLCLPVTESRVFDYDYRACGDALCANGETGCPVRGLVLETEPMRMQNPLINIPQIVMAALGEIRVREPIQVVYELLNPPERCEYAIEPRFWNVAFIDGYEYMSPFSAEQFAMYTGANTSLAAIDGGYWQVVRSPFIGHAGGMGGGAIIEDSASAIELVAGGERCRAIQVVVDAAVRDSLATSINGVLGAWFEGIDDTLECIPCGQLGCELACRFR